MTTGRPAAQRSGPILARAPTDCVALCGYCSYNNQCVSASISQSVIAHSPIEDSLSRTLPSCLRESPSKSRIRGSNMVNGASFATAYYMTGWWSLGTPSEVRRVTFSACERPTIVKKRASAPTSKSDLAKSDAHAIRPHEYRDLPDLTDQALARAVVNRGGRPRSANPRKLISIRLPVDVIERWKATGPGWQTRIADRLSKRR